MFRLLTELVPHDPFEVLKSQRAACSGMVWRSGAVQDYFLLVQARMKELQLQRKVSPPPPPPTHTHTHTCSASSTFTNSCFPETIRSGGVAA